LGNKALRAEDHRSEHEPGHPRRHDAEYAAE
jgi:hypothetical protein